MFHFSVKNFLNLSAIVASLVTSLSQGTTGCFPIDDVFKVSCLWMKSVGIESRHHIDFCQHSGGAKRGSRMTVTPGGKGADKKKAWHTDCVQAFPNNRYLVKRDNSANTVEYQCIKFSPLTDKVVRQEFSKVVMDKSEADCLSATYTLDDSVFVAIDELKPVACPLSGGYQILMHRSDSISKERKCLENAPSYRPHLQFQCDQVGSSHVLADFGPHCTLMELQKSGPMMGKYMAHLDCVDSWQENSGTSKQSTSVLMRMQGSNLSLWCLHLKRLPNSAHSSVTSEEESLYQAYLSVDGSCSPDVQGQGSVPTAFEMFGKLASFIPGDDIKCQEASYLHECESQAISKCQESTDCPKTCGRCLGEKTTTSTCSMPSTVLGTWESFPHGEGHIITVHGDSVKTSSQGDFKCWSTHKDMFSLVQTGKHSTCMPYHACTRIERLAPGLIIYEMFPANRKKDSGEVQSCKQTRESNERFNKGTFSSTTTLMQPQKLHETPCNIEGKIISEVMNMEPQCNLVIHECSGSCTTFNISIDEGTCGNKTAEEAGLLTQHTCLAVLPGGEINMVLTRSPDNDQYLCWVKLSTMFFALSPDKCNKDQIDAVMRIVNPDDVPNTFSLLKRRPPTIEKDPEKDGSAQAKLSITAFALAFLILALTNL